LREDAAAGQGIEYGGDYRLKRGRVRVSAQVIRRLGGGNNCSFLRGLLDFLFLVEGSAEIVDADHEDDQKRQRDGEFENG
jgi:hypothetical protein